MSDTTAQIAAKGCNSTGITEDLAKRLHDNLGRKVVAVVELVSAGRAEKLDGSEKVSLSILTIEPAPNSATEDHLRDLARAFHYERKLAEDGPQLLEPGDGPEPTVKDVLARGNTIVGTDDDGEVRLLTDADLEAAEQQLALEEADDADPDDRPDIPRIGSPFATPSDPVA
ncbi:hypothetical protein QWY28_13365 [Nocardioides sp. SOB77]|uniref:Uncharacterized protein n=1 Tax=Nocardioides oceani TaxID=3058369 RepID=A0ABT8FGY7_9ACTN|nr:hypothetical protein [Nocardioides oceani]MDN4173944.1 hypothetical protein [Nocardioides oceani]